MQTNSNSSSSPFARKISHLPLPLLFILFHTPLLSLSHVPEQKMQKMDFLIKLLLISSLLSSTVAFNLTAIEFPSLPFTFTFNSVAAADDCYKNNQNPPNSIGKKPQNLKLHLNHRPLHHPNSTKQASLIAAAHKDLSRLQTLFNKKTNKIKTQNKNIPDKKFNSTHAELDGKVTATIQSGVSLGSGEYFINAFIGTPANHYSLILDTGSDLNWLQCVPCYDCFEQRGPVFDPAASSSFRHVSCSDPRCSLVASPDPNSTCRARDPCPYFYWYGDKSNTTGDLAVETFTVNLTGSGGQTLQSHKVDDVIFGCGHWNRGLFHGAAGLLGLGRGPLSFASQLRALYGNTFSYCLVDRNSELSVTSKLIFGEEEGNHPNLNYTSFVAGKENSSSSAIDTFYYVHVKEIKIGEETLPLAQEIWALSEEDGTGGTIIDSGTTLSYFVDPAYDLIRQTFITKVKYPLVEDFPVLSPCYNVTGIDNVDMPGFTIVFGDGATWDFPVENYFIRLEPEGIMCLAILGTPTSSLSIIGNYQQQNFLVMYDTDKSRLGFAPMRCAEV